MATNPYATGQPPPGGQGSPNLYVNPYLSPYLGMFSGTSSANAQPLFGTPGLSPLQQGWMSRMMSGAKGSQNMGNIPLPVMSYLPPPPPPSPTAPSAPTPATPATPSGDDAGGGRGAFPSVSAP